VRKQKACKKRGTLWNNAEGIDVRPKKDRNPEGCLVLRSLDGAQKCQVRVAKSGGMGKAISHDQML
jgi:hypothetical protein